MAQLVHCVICIDHTGDETLHIFSTAEKAEAFALADDQRGHVLYDYELDNPDRQDKPLPRMN